MVRVLVAFFLTVAVYVIPANNKHVLERVSGGDSRNYGCMAENLWGKPCQESQNHFKNYLATDRLAVGWIIGAGAHWLNLEPRVTVFWFGVMCLGLCAGLLTLTIPAWLSVLIMAGFIFQVVIDIGATGSLAGAVVFAGWLWACKAWAGPGAAVAIITEAVIYPEYLVLILPASVVLFWREWKFWAGVALGAGVLALVYPVAFQFGARQVGAMGPGLPLLDFKGGCFEWLFHRADIWRTIPAFWGFYLAPLVIGLAGAFFMFAAFLEGTKGKDAETLAAWFTLAGFGWFVLDWHLWAAGKILTYGTPALVAVVWKARDHWVGRVALVFFAVLSSQTILTRVLGIDHPHPYPEFHWVGW